MLISKSSNSKSLALYPLTLTSCLRNAVSMFHVIGQEREWRRSQGLPAGFESLDKHKPILAIGPSKPLGDQLKMADYFRKSSMLLGAGPTSLVQLNWVYRWLRWAWRDLRDGENCFARSTNNVSHIY